MTSSHFHHSAGNNVDLSELEDIKPTLIDCNISHNRDEKGSEDGGSATGPVYLSILRLCFWDRKLQENEYEEIKKVIKSSRQLIFNCIDLESLTLLFL